MHSDNTVIDLVLDSERLFIEAYRLSSILRMKGQRGGFRKTVADDTMLELPIRAEK